MEGIKDIYNGFLFSTYLEAYIKRKGLKIAFVADVLDMKYETFRSKIKRDSFTYQEIHFLDMYFPDLRYLENRNNYINIRLTQRGRSIQDLRN